MNSLERLGKVMAVYRRLQQVCWKHDRPKEQGAWGAFEQLGLVRK